MDAVSITGAVQKLVEENSPHFVLYRKISSKSYDAYCTGCHQRFTAERANLAPFKHHEYGLCPECCEEVEFLSMGRGRRTLTARKNFAIFEADGFSHLRIKCIRCELSWLDYEDLEPEYNDWVVTAYDLYPDKAVQYVERWNQELGKMEWKQARTPHEPVFHQTAFGPSDKEYYLVNDCEIDKTFLKYCMPSECDINYQIQGLLITYLCKCAHHPKMEYMLKGGLPRLAFDIVEGHGPRYVNWKSNDLKVMLRISKQELLFLQQNEGFDYTDYIEFRKYAFGGKIDKQGTEALKVYKALKRQWYHLKSCTEKLEGRPDCVQNIMRYILRQSDLRMVQANNLMIMYYDYLRDCKKLGYDLHDDAVAFPKKLDVSHDRAVEARRLLESEMTYRHNNKQAKRFEKARELLQFQFGELEVIIPKDVREIVTEGARNSHCVASYIDQHSRGRTNIAFLRFQSGPDATYYTLEISNDLSIKQYHGYKNNVVRNGGKPVTQEVEDFIAAYKQYLVSIQKSWARKLKQAQKQHEKELVA